MEVLMGATRRLTRLRAGDPLRSIRLPFRLVAPRSCHLPDGNRRDRIVQSGGRAFIHGPPRGARRTFWPRLGLTVGTVGIRPSLDALGARRAFYGSTRRSSTPPSPGHAPESRPALAGHARPHRAPAAARRADERLRPEPPEPGPSRATC